MEKGDFNMNEVKQSTNKVYNVSSYPKCFNTVDIVLLSIMDNELGVLLIKRLEEPFANYWALPGGFLDVHSDDDTLSAAKRELEEETGLKNIFIEQLYTFSKKLRDPREAYASEPIRIISVAHYALIDHNKVNAIAGSDAKEVKWFKLSDLPKLAFDHHEIVNMAIDRVRNKIGYTNVGFEFLPEKFTIPELQAILEKVIGEKLDRNNFRTKVLSLDVLIELSEKKQEGKGKPSSYYKLNKKNVSILKTRGLF